MDRAILAVYSSDSVFLEQGPSEDPLQEQLKRVFALIQKGLRKGPLSNPSLSAIRINDLQ
jgi:hypothetical protein